MSNPILDPEFLRKQVEQETGLSDWGDTEFEEGLGRLCRAASEETSLSGEALEGFVAVIKGHMINRLKLYDDRKRYPEISRQEIKAPFVVTGLPRSGTTILHSLLAQDPAARSPLTWEVAQPSPPPRAETYTTDSRIAESQAMIDSLPAQFKAMHAMAATLPEECNGLTTMAFLSPNFAANYPLRSYAEWLFNQADACPAYAFHKQVLQHFQAFAPGEYWVLKSPPHMFWFDSLMATYPDARVIVTHRDPAQVLPSNASLISFLQGESADKKTIGKQQNADWSTAVNRAMVFRDNLIKSGVDKKQFVDVQYANFVKDPLSVVETIYAHFGMTLSDDARGKMTQFLANNKQGKHGKHVYTAEEFGMTADALRREFGDYIDCYSVAT